MTFLWKKLSAWQSNINNNLHPTFSNVKYPYKSSTPQHKSNGSPLMSRFIVSLLAISMPGVSAKSASRLQHTQHISSLISRNERIVFIHHAHSVHKIGTAIRQMLKWPAISYVFHIKLVVSMGMAYHVPHLMSKKVFVNLWYIVLLIQHKIYHQIQNFKIQFIKIPNRLHYIWSTILLPILAQYVTLGTSPMPLTSKNKSGLMKVPVHFNVY